MTAETGLSGRVALVTGGGRGIGRAIALALAREGADVVVSARTEEQIAAVAAEITTIGRRSLALKADVTVPEEVEAMAKAAAAEMEPIDILVNAAGDAESAPLARTALSLWDRMLAVNLTSVFLCTVSFLPSMRQRRWGRVINIASTAGLEGHAYVSAYCAAKHGVVGFTRAVAAEVAGTGVTINALCPGYVDTYLTRKSAERISHQTGLAPEDALQRLARLNPSGQLLQPEQVATAALDLARQASESVNGQAISL